MILEIMDAPPISLFRCLMKLSDIKKHTLFPFAGFRTNDAAFLMLELFWTSLAQEALGADLSNRCVPLGIAGQDKDNLGNPNMLDFWIPEKKRGARILLNENPNGFPPHASESQSYLPYSPLYVSASVRERPEPHCFPTGGFIDKNIYTLEEVFLSLTCQMGLYQV